MDNRFIPPCVGNSSEVSPPRRLRSVHPHMRGELGWPAVVAVITCGSSPHAWGTRRFRAEPSAARRFIPTCVGNSSSKRCAKATSPVHPHMRGELDRIGRGRRPESGSSPHAWGTRRERAGFVSLVTVHPHMRGELVAAAGLRGTVCGSSPHAWGTRSICRSRRTARRFIPPCVGNSHECARGFVGLRFIPTCVGNP